MVSLKPKLMPTIVCETIDKIVRKGDLDFTGSCLHRTIMRKIANKASSIWNMKAIPDIIGTEINNAKNNNFFQILQKKTLHLLQTSYKIRTGS